MTTSSEYAQKATATLHEVLGIAPGDFDAKGTAIVIERAIKTQHASARPRLAGRLGRRRRRRRTVWYDCLVRHLR